MPRHLIIDGNNVLHAMRVHAPIREVGRESMLRIIERWAAKSDDVITIVFDGPMPQCGLARQMQSPRIHVLFSGTRTADDLIVEMIAASSDPGRVRVVTADGAIIHEARAARCVDITPRDFIAELFPMIARTDKREPRRGNNSARSDSSPGQHGTSASPNNDKPAAENADDVDDVLRMMNAENLELHDDRDIFDDDDLKP